MRTSAFWGEGAKELGAQIEEMFHCGKIDENSVVLTNMRHVESIMNAESAVTRALEALDGGVPADMLFIDIFEALNSLGEVVGMTVSEEIVDKIFEKFCVGK